jgi:hypothetical protein
MMIHRLDNSLISTAYALSLIKNPYFKNKNQINQIKSKEEKKFVKKRKKCRAIPRSGCIKLAAERSWQPPVC